MRASASSSSARSTSSPWAQKERMIGNFAFETEYGTVVGFENHSGRTKLGSGLAPLGKVIVGCGNNGQVGTEGAHYKNVFGTYSHGPVLPKNPGLCRRHTPRGAQAQIRAMRS